MKNISNLPKGTKFVLKSLKTLEKNKLLVKMREVEGEERIETELHGWYIAEGIPCGISVEEYEQWNKEKIVIGSSIYAGTNVVFTESTSGRSLFYPISYILKRVK